MNKLIVISCVLLSLSTVFADKVQPKRHKFNKRAAYEARVAANGGLVTRPYAGKYIAIVNGQKRVVESDFFDPKQSIQRIFQYPVKIVPSGTDVSDSALVITISDDPKAPALLVAPEMPWAGVNVGALAADKPSAAVLKARLQKELWRAFMFACGAANSITQPCVMRPLFGLRDLDSQAISVPCPDSLNRVAICAKALGIGETSRCVYRQACEEGWAPAPTNDIQKAIWEKVHSEKERGPVNGLKILPPNNKK